MKDKWLQNLIPDWLYIKLQYRKNMGYFPNLKNPLNFNEKMQWLKLYDRSPLHTQSADKYRARDYIRQVIGEKYLIPLLYRTEDPEQIKPENMPEIPCVIKTNQDCGGVFFVHDKAKTDWRSTRKFLKEHLQNNHYYYSREWQYKNIKPCIIVEEMLLTKKGELPYDYKIYCFNGKAKMIAVDQDRNKPTKARNWYDMQWQKHDIFWNTKGDERLLPKPLFFEKMIELSEKLARPFKFLRVDWYDVDGKLFIGELTLHPGGGMVHFYPHKWDRVLGDYLTL